MSKLPGPPSGGRVLASCTLSGHMDHNAVIAISSTVAALINPGLSPVTVIVRRLQMRVVNYAAAVAVTPPGGYFLQRLDFAAGSNGGGPSVLNGNIFPWYDGIRRQGTKAAQIAALPGGTILGTVADQGPYLVVGGAIALAFTPAVASTAETVGFATVPRSTTGGSEAYDFSFGGPPAPDLRTPFDGYEIPPLSALAVSLWTASWVGLGASLQVDFELVRNS